MSKLICLFTVISLLLLLDIAYSQQLVVYEHIPGRNASEHYTCRIKLDDGGDNNTWMEAFVLQTKAQDEEGYFELVHGWTASWVAFESDFKGGPVVVEISKKDGTPITEAMVRPIASAAPAVISNGKAYVTFTEPANVNVDINGQMENNYTGHGYTGEVHTITLFANPIYRVPDIANSNVKILQAGEGINSLSRAEWDTLIFAPGIHNIGMPYQILSNEVLFIPGDAIVKGTIHPPNAWGDAAAQNFTVYGSGTISGEDIDRNPDNQSRLFKPFTYQAEGARLEGFVVADPAFHTFNMGHSRGGTDNPNIYKNLKILAWRVNSDGINAFRNSEISDCFFRVQDDAFYLGANGVNTHDNVVWNDANGAVLYLQSAPDGSTNTFRDITVIYHRAAWHWWYGGRIISMRETSPGTTISNVHVQNILVEDPLPAFPPFYAFMLSGMGDVILNNIVIENVYQEHDGVNTTTDTNRGKPRNTLTGLDNNRKWENITFKNCYFNGNLLSSFEDGAFDTAFVDANTVIFDLPTKPPISGFSASATHIVQGQTVSFTDTSSHFPTSWNWTFDGATPSSSTQQNPKVTYSSTGSFSVSLTTTNSFGSRTHTENNYITVTDSIDVDEVKIENCPIDLTVNSTYQLDSKVLPTNVTDQTVKWTSSDMSVLSVSANGLLTALKAGTATITATANSNGVSTSCNVGVLDSTDYIMSLHAPSEVSPNEVITVAVAYKASESRDLRVFIQQNSEPWTSYGATTITVAAGTRTDSIDFTVSESISLATGAYKIVANLLPVGGAWSERFDERTISNVSTIEGETILSLQDEVSYLYNIPKLFPNPVQNLLIIEFGDTATRKIKVFDMLGYLLYSIETSKESIQIDIKKLEAQGTLLVEVQRGHFISIHKLISH